MVKSEKADPVEMAVNWLKIKRSEENDGMLRINPEFDDYEGPDSLDDSEFKDDECPSLLDDEIPF